MLSHVWEISLGGMTVDCLGDKEEGFRCILERDDLQEMSVVMANRYL